MTKNTIIEILSFSIVVCLSLMSSENWNGILFLKIFIKKYIKWNRDWSDIRKTMQKSLKLTEKYKQRKWKIICNKF
jgi:hypothetical protein